MLLRYRTDRLLLQEQVLRLMQVLLALLLPHRRRNHHPLPLPLRRHKTRHWALQEALLQEALPPQHSQRAKGLHCCHRIGLHWRWVLMPVLPPLVLLQAMRRLRRGWGRQVQG
jgi:hypothetical protein